MKISILALALGGPTTAYAQHNRRALLWIGIASTHDDVEPSRLVFAGQHPTMRDSHTAFLTFLRTKNAQIAMIPRFFGFTWCDL